MKTAVIALGVLSALLIVAQLTIGQAIVSGNGGLKLIKTHQHTGYLTVLVSLAYIALSLAFILSNGRKAKV